MWWGKEDRPFTQYTEGVRMLLCFEFHRSTMELSEMVFPSQRHTGGRIGRSADTFRYHSLTQPAKSRLACYLVT